jgi:hypothetical protein
MRELREWAQQRPSLTVALIMLFSTLLVWAPFLRDPASLYRYWDGPHYAYLAKTLYDVPSDHPFVAYGLTPAYYATHLPAYPVLIRVLALLTLGDYLLAMLLATLLTATLAAVLFHEVLVRFELVRSPLWTAMLFAFLPPRWVIYHSVGATEPLFLCFVFGAFLAYRKDRPWAVAACIAAASFTRIMGVLLVPAFVISYLLERRVRHALIVPVSLFATLAVLLWHRAMYGDLFAYFTRNVGESGHLAFPPIRAFFAYVGDGDTHSSELYLALYVLYGLGTLALVKHRPFFLYSATFFVFNLFVFHFDLSRMFVPVAPFALLVAFDRVWSEPAARIAAPLLVYLDCQYAWGLIPSNAVELPAYESLLRVLG